MKISSEKRNKILTRENAGVIISSETRTGGDENEF